ncbi:hypothetical protein ACJRO7_018023 [Eucalyptus globulus]|uniref:3'-5' exonuclease domain-containing protein n=1 Tax=Eucalyptus globulus TaxID=34317 RepID=A0ABD3KS84_EUCGL
MHSLHKITFYGEQTYTCVTDDPSVVTRWIMEWRPNLEPGVVHPVATLQLCVAHSCLIFQILHAEYVPALLHTFLGNLNYTRSDDYGLFVSHMVDLRGLAVGRWRNPSLGYMGLKKLVEVILRKALRRLKKLVEITLSHWDEKTLTARQVEYACLDAFVTFELGMALRPWLVGRVLVDCCVGANCVMVPDMVAAIFPRQVRS